MIRLYGEGDIREAERRLRSAWMLLAAVLAPLLGGYVLALMKGSYAASLVPALLMPEIPAGSFAKKLYSTYLSYLPKDAAMSVYQHFHKERDDQ